MTNINSKKQKPYFQVYTKKSFLGHTRIKYSDGDGELIRGKNINTNKITFPTHHEIGSKDIQRIDINNEEYYVPGQKIYLTDEQAERVKNKIFSQDEKDSTYFGMGNNCIDFANDIIKEINPYKSVRDYIHPSVKYKASSLYDYAKNSPIKKKINIYKDIIYDINDTLKKITKENKNIKTISETRNDFETINKFENQIKQQNLLENVPTQTMLPNKREETTKNLLEKYVEPELLPKKAEIISSPKSEEVKSKSEDLFKQLQENNNPHEDILLKKYADVTEDELKETMKYSGYETQDKVLRNKLDDFVQKTYDYHYGSDPAKLDATGRMIESGVRVPFAKESKLLSTKDNIPMDEAFRKIAEQTSPFGVKSLQKGLNNLTLAESNSTPLKEDDVLGPKTTSRVKEILANHSLDEVNKNIKVGNFSSMLEENRSKMIDNDTLKNTMTTLRPQDGGLFLQKNINNAGAEKPDFEKLKEDNDIGEKTTTALNQLKEGNEDKLTAFAQENMETEFEKTKEMEEREKQKQEEEEQAEREKEAEEKRQEEEEKEREEQEKIENAQSSLATSNSLLK